MKLYPYQNKVAVKGYEGLYEVGRNGNVYSSITTKTRRKGQLKPHIKNGYLAVNLFKDGKCKHHYIHRLVAVAFIENTQNFKEVNHKNCDKFDNSVDNLEWCTRKQNLEHSYTHGLKRQGEKHGGHKLTLEQVKDIRTKKLTQKEYAEKYNVKQCTISAIQCEKLWKGGD